MSDKKTVSLALGSGGARGLAHIGIIEELEERGYQIDTIAGSSMGAVVGGIFAMGKMDEYKEWICSQRKRDILKLLDLRFSGGGLLHGQVVIDKLRNMLGDSYIENLNIPFRAVAVDIVKGREVWFDKGSLYDAIRASIAIPGIFSPYHIDDMTLVDGGLLNPVPVTAVLGTSADLIIAVDVNAETEDTGDSGQEIPGLLKEDDPPAPSLVQKFLHKFRRRKPDSLMQYFRTLSRSLELMEAQITRQNLSVCKPDLVISVPHTLCMIHEFHRAKDIIEAGRKIAKDQLDTMEERLNT